jgi:glycosyltransferase involved in cell wall biosynthesis
MHDPIPDRELMPAADLAVVLTFHAEGAHAAAAIASVQRAVVPLMEAGLRAEVVCVLDAADEPTATCVSSLAQRAGWTIVRTEYRDPGQARNRGVAESTGTFVAIQDGDDYMSREWLLRAYKSANAMAGPAVFHPEYVLAFGDDRQFFQHISTSERAFHPDGLLMFNAWKVQVVAYRDIFVQIPYLPRVQGNARYIYEDWQWHCETLGRGIPHEIVAGTAILYRASARGVQHTDHNTYATFGPTTLFSNRRVLPRSAGRGSP